MQFFELRIVLLAVRAAALPIGVFFAEPRIDAEAAEGFVAF